MSEQSSALPPVIKLLVDAGLVTLYLGALIFVAGWSYADRYFAELGLNISAVDGLEPTNFSAYALWVFRDTLLTSAVILAAVVLTIALFQKKVGPIQETWLATLAAVFVVFSLFGAAFFGAERARTQVEDLFVDGYHNTVRIKILAAKDSPLAEYFSKRPGLSENGCLRKIYMDRKNLYAYAGYASEKGPHQQILIIPLSEVALIETLPIRDLCEL